MADTTITKEMTIGKIIREHPDVAPIIMSYGLRCVGCHVAYHETLEQGCQGHGMPEDVINELVEEVNEFIKQQEDEGKAD